MPARDAGFTLAWVETCAGEHYGRFKCHASLALSMTGPRPITDAVN